MAATRFALAALLLCACALGAHGIKLGINRPGMANMIKAAVQGRALGEEFSYSPGAMVRGRSRGMPGPRAALS